MKLDERGNVYVTGPKGVWIFAPDGEHLGVIEVPENVGNVNWGDDDWQLALHPRLDLRVPRAHEGRRQQARLHELGGTPVDKHRPEVGRTRHPGPAERRDHRRRRVRRLGRAGARDEPERRRERRAAWPPPAARPACR